MRAEPMSVTGQKMEGVNMPASFKNARRWLVGATSAAILLAALPGIGRADTLSICVSHAGKIKGINSVCKPNQTPLSWTNEGEDGPPGPQGVTGDPGPTGSQGATGPAGIQGPPGAQGPQGPQGAQGLQGGPGAKGPAGEMGQDGIQGVVGPAGDKGPVGLDARSTSFIVGGTLGTLGNNEGIELSGSNSILGNLLVMGPGNGADLSFDAIVPINTGNAHRFLVNVDNNPGTNGLAIPAGVPASFFFSLCNYDSFSCNIGCVIVDPDTTCADSVNNVFFFEGDRMYVSAFSDYFLANAANVKWSTAFTHFLQ